MARLSDASGLSFEIQPVGYQYDAATVTHEYDRNWLQDRITVTDSARTWSTVAPTLLTWEINEIIEWLRLVAEQPGGWPKRWDRTTEPSLAFEAAHSAEGLELRICLNLDFLPPERRDGVYYEGEDTVLTFHPTNAELRGVADELEREMRAFPVR
jgi:hypothetical protein